MDKEISIIELGARKRLDYEASISYDSSLYDDSLEVGTKEHKNNWPYIGPECILVQYSDEDAAHNLRVWHHVGDMIVAGRKDDVINSSPKDEKRLK